MLFFFNDTATTEIYTLSLHDALIIATDRPTPEQRVAALRAGAWDFVRHPGDPEEVALKLQTYVQAKRNIDVAFAEGPVGPAARPPRPVARALQPPPDPPASVPL